MRAFVLGALLAMGAAAGVHAADNQADTLVVPARTILLDKHVDGGGQDLVTLIFDSSDRHFRDPGQPRFLFVDSEGRAALGIGGFVKGVASADFGGAVDNDTEFIPYDIAVPDDAARRSRLGATMAETTLALSFVTRMSRLGLLRFYVESNFVGGGDGGYGFKLHQAWISLGNVKMGLTRSLFQDASAGVSTIDYNGPCGEVSHRDVQIRYTPGFGSGFSAGVALEIPSASVTTIDGRNSSISQRLPDLPVYLQWAYGQGSHIRLSAMLRNLSYRNLVTGSNRFVTGYGVQLSGVTSVSGGLKARWLAVYGSGIASLFEDLSGHGYDLVPAGDSDRSGRLCTTDALGLTAGLSYDFGRGWMASAAYSRLGVYGQRTLGSDAMDYTQYVVGNIFWTPLSDLQLGLEYIHGNRCNVDGRSGTANRLQAMVKYSF